jgi:hypothetical protein
VQNVLYQFGGTGHVCDDAASWGPSFAGGDGSSGTPYLVCNRTHLDNIRNFVASGKVYEIRDHIDLAAGGSWTAIPNFQGTVQGLLDDSNVPQFSIRKMTTAVGFIADSNAGAATISNLRFSQPLVQHTEIDSGARIGTVLGQTSFSNNYAVTISRVHVFEPVVRITSATINHILGGIVGYVGSPFTLANSVLTNGIIEQPSGSGGFLGGLVGGTSDHNLHPTININSNSVSVTIRSNDSSMRAGGVAGYGGYTNKGVSLGSNVVSVSISTTGKAGGIAAECQDYCYLTSNSVSGTVVGGDYVGGLLGKVAALRSTNDSFVGTVEGDEFVGGFAGTSGTPFVVGGGVVYSSLRTAATVKGRDYVGGIFGLLTVNTGVNTWTFSLSKWSFGGSVVATGNYVGGLAGALINSTGTVSLTNSICTGSVTGNEFVGGLVGFLGNPPTTGTGWGPISKVAVTGAVSATVGSVGALVGGYHANFVGTTNTNGIGNSVASAFWDRETTGQSSSGFGDSGTGLTTAAMRSKDSFTDWDFNTIWRMNSTTRYPELRP